MRESDHMEKLNGRLRVCNNQIKHPTHGIKRKRYPVQTTATCVCCGLEEVNFHASNCIYICVCVTYCNKKLHRDYVDC